MSTGLENIAEVAAAPRVTMLGVELPRRFADLADECRAVREGAGVFAAAFRTWVRMSGEDRVSFLQGMVSNDVKKLATGQGAYATLLTQQGRVVTDLRIYAGADHFLLDFPTAAAPAAQQALERLIVADDVEMHPIEVTVIGLEGPRAIEIAAQLGLVLSGDGFQLVDAESLRVITASHTGEAGLLIGGEETGAADVWRRCRDAGAQPIGMEALNVLRIEAGIPWIGVDMGEDELVMEVGLDSAISFTKGCYLGQEVVERVAARGHVNRKRAGLTIDGSPVPAGTPLYADDREVGRVTSAVCSPLLGKTIGMGYVRRELLAPGTALTAKAADEQVPVHVAVAPLPFVAGQGRVA